MNNIYFFTGEDSYRLHEELLRWKKGFIEKHGDLNLTVLDSEVADINEILNAMTALPFLGEKRLVVINNMPISTANRASEETQNKEEKILNTIDEVPESTILVFCSAVPDKRRKFYKEIIKKAELKEFNLLKGSQLSIWIKNKFKEKEVEVSPVVISRLVDLVGNDLNRMNNEIEKIVLYTDGKNPTVEDAEKLVLPRLQENIFALTDAMGSHNPKNMINHFQTLVQFGEPIHQIFYMLIRQARLIIGAKSLLDEGRRNDIAREVGVAPFVVNRLISQANNFSWEELNFIYDELLKIDTELKTSKIETSVDDTRMFELRIETFFINIGK